MAVALALVVADPPVVTAVRVATLGTQTAVRILTSGEVAAAEVTRQGDEIVVRLQVPAAEDLTTPAAQRPIERIRVSREPSATLVCLQVAPEVAFETRRDAGGTTIVFAETPAAAPSPSIPPDLYARLFPTGLQAPEKTAPTTPPAEGAREGLALGRLTVRPGVQASWVDADVTVLGPQPVRDHYLQIAPALGVFAPLADGQLALSYQPRLRFFSHIPGVDETAHLADASLEVPLGSRVRLRGAYGYTRATLETSFVDPGHEYFYDLSRYTLQTATVSGTVDVAPRIFLEGQAGWWSSRFDHQGAGFFGYDSRTARAGLGYELGRELRAVLSYSYQSVPSAPDRPIVEGTAQDVDLTLTGPLGPVMTGRVFAGYRTQTSPKAIGASHDWSGLVLGGSLRRELGRASSLELQLNRTPTVSAFEANAYYVTNSVYATLTAPLPFESWCRVLGGFLRNDYPNPASAIDSPRRDDVLSWGLGLGRALGRRGSVSADYRREKRDSNVPGYSVTTSGFILQLGYGYTGASR